MMFQRTMGVILEMILTVSGRSKAAKQKTLSAQMNKAISALPPTEFRNLTELREALVAETVEAGAPSTPTPEVAALYADQTDCNARPGLAGQALSNRPDGRWRALRMAWS